MILTNLSYEIEINTMSACLVGQNLTEIPYFILIMEYWTIHPCQSELSFFNQEIVAKWP